MLVTQVTELSKSRSKVYIDQEFAFVLYKGELRLYHIKEGQQLSEEDYRTIMQEVLPKRAKLRAMNLLQGREYTTAQLRTKLQQGFYPAEIIEQAIVYVAGFHYIDDLRYAVDYITYHEDSRSRRRIEQDLQGKGIPAATMEEAWQVWRENGGEQDEQRMIREQLHKKHYDPEAETDWKERQKIYAFLARKGPPAELVPMFEQQVLPYLDTLTPGVICSQMVKLCGVPESQVEDTLKDLIDGQTNPTIATYAKTGEVHIRVTASGEDTKAAGKAIKPVVKELKSRFGADIYSTKAETTLEMAVADLLMANDLTVTTAESCTGGMIAARIINVPGVSECYKAGLVTYSNKAKRKFLGVRKSTLDKYGAVSSKTASEMAKGAALLMKSDVAVAVTGIAGPDGGTEEKPVGLVYIGCSVKGEVTVKEYHFSGTRSQIREATTSAALILMRSCILKYFSKVTFGKK